MAKADNRDEELARLRQELADCTRSLSAARTNNSNLKSINERYRQQIAILRKRLEAWQNLHNHCSCALQDSRRLVEELQQLAAQQVRVNAAERAALLSEQDYLLAKASREQELHQGHPANKSLWPEEAFEAIPNEASDTQEEGKNDGA